MIKSFTKGTSRAIALLALALCCCTLFAQRDARAANTVHYDGNDPHCGDGCCQRFTVTVDKPTDKIVITLSPGTGAADCFDHGCWTSQGTGTLTFSQGTNYYDFEIDASHSDALWTGPFPHSITVWICGSSACLNLFPYYRWTTSGTSNESGSNQPVYHSSCDAQPCSSGCSYITASQEALGCGTEICYFNQSGATVSSFSLQFTPDIDLNAPCSGTSGPRCSAPNNAAHFIGNNCNWTWAEVNGVWVFTAGKPGCGAGSCTDPICLFIPYCTTYRTTEVTLTSPTNPPSCTGSATDMTVGMKQANGRPSVVIQGSQNFPNPVNSQNGFKTSIPFQTAEAGTATIRILDASGKQILTTDEEVSYAGEHFFYFTADNLPAGTYFYTIEFPRGVMIVKNTMVVVK